MGCGYDFACMTCKKTYYLGYGSYSTWMLSRSLAEYDSCTWEPVYKSERGESIKNLQKNQNIRKCLAEHNDHEHTYIGWDWCGARDGVLYSETGEMGAEQVFIPDWGKYEHIDLAPDPPLPEAKLLPDTPEIIAFKERMTRRREREARGQL